MTETSALAGYLAPPDRADDLVTELGGDVREVYERLVVGLARPRPPAFAANVWHDPMKIRIGSIGDAARQLRAMQRNWALYSFAHHRRAALIAEKLPKVSAKPLVFGTLPPSAPLGSWTLLAPDLMLAAPHCSSPFPNGEVTFVEDKEGPPSRAYLKLWETFTRIGVRPLPGETCLDLGACPGGWTWVLASLGARVVSVDKAPLDPGVAAMTGVEVRRESAFGLDPNKEPVYDWLFSDVICYPERLFRLVERWLQHGKARRFVCTIKFQGETDFQTLARFAAIPGSQLMHLHHNKHELTWIRL
jgi:23S rRNA (cytidine2498-2'-O)-methyltransferase